jgi:hypothetical protein
MFPAFGLLKVRFLISSFSQVRFLVSGAESSKSFPRLQSEEQPLRGRPEICHRAPTKIIDFQILLPHLSPLNSGFQALLEPTSFFLEAS